MSDNNQETREKIETTVTRRRHIVVDVAPLRDARPAGGWHTRAGLAARAQRNGVIRAQRESLPSELARDVFDLQLLVERLAHELGLGSVAAAFATAEVSEDATQTELEEQREQLYELLATFSLELGERATQVERLKLLHQGYEQLGQAVATWSLVERDFESILEPDTGASLYEFWDWQYRIEEILLSARRFDARYREDLQREAWRQDAQTMSERQRAEALKRDRELHAERLAMANANARMMLDDRIASAGPNFFGTGHRCDVRRDRLERKLGNSRRTQVEIPKLRFYMQRDRSGHAQDNDARRLWRREVRRIRGT